MKSFLSIGEALIDFIPSISDTDLKDVPSFTRVVGGAPANVCGAIAKLGGKASLVTQLGNDAFGNHIIDVLLNANVDISYIKRSDAYDTSLAFVTLAANGQREFKFYRKTAADLFYDAKYIEEIDLTNVGMVHFCSVDLIESKMKQAHYRLLNTAIDHHIPICFDPNLRLFLWDDQNRLKTTVHEFIPYASVLKIADDELEFICNTNDIEVALPQLMVGNVKIVILTRGSKGASIYTKIGIYHHCGYSVNAIDTTGAGDAFIGAFIYCFLASNYTDVMEISAADYSRYLAFCNAYAATVTLSKGALAAMVSYDEFINGGIYEQ